MPGRHVAESVRRSQIIKAAYHVAAARGLGGLTVRRVATKAGVSTGLVLFHFETKDQLIIALLDWLLATTTVLHVSEGIAPISSLNVRLKGLTPLLSHVPVPTPMQGLTTGIGASGAPKPPRP